MDLRTLRYVTTAVRLESITKAATRLRVAQSALSRTIKLLEDELGMVLLVRHPHGVKATNTRERLEAVGSRMGLPRAEYEAWVGGFEFLQMLRLRTQLEGLGPAGGGATPNLIRVDALNYIDRRILKESLRVARRLQRRIELDYIR